MGNSKSVDLSKVDDPVLPQSSDPNHLLSYPHSEEKKEKLFKDNNFLNSMQSMERGDGCLCDFHMYDKKGMLDDDAILIISKEILQRAEKIKILKIQFSLNQSFTDEGLTYLALAIRSLPKLTSLSLYLTETNVSDKGVQRLMEAIRGNQNLCGIEIGLSETKINDSSLLYIAQTLYIQNNIYLFNFGIQCNPIITEKGFNYLFDGLKCLKKCKEMNLMLAARGMSFNDKNFKDLGKAFTSLDKIEKLVLAFHNCQISDSGLKAFGGIIKKVNSLKFLDLSIHNSKATFEGWRSFREGYAKNLDGGVFTD